MKKPDMKVAQKMAEAVCGWSCDNTELFIQEWMERDLIDTEEEKNCGNCGHSTCGGHVNLTDCTDWQPKK